MTNLIKRRGETIATVADDYAVVAWLVNQIDDGEAIGGVVYAETLLDVPDDWFDRLRPEDRDGRTFGPSYIVSEDCEDPVTVWPLTKLREMADHLFDHYGCWIEWEAVPALS